MVMERIRTLNRTALISALLLLLYCSINLFNGEVFLATAQMVLLIMVIVGIAINHFGMFNTSLIFFIATINLAILSQCWMLGASSSNHYFFFVTALFPLLVTDRKDLIYGLFLFSAIGFALAQYLFATQTPLFSLPYGTIFRYLNMGVTVGLMLLGVRHYKRQVASYEAWMQNESLTLQQQSDEVESQRDQLLELNEELTQQNEKISQHRMRLEKSFWDIQMLSEIGKNITSKLSIPEIIDAIYEDLSLVMSVEVFMLGIWDRRQERLQVTELHRGVEKVYHTYTRDDEENFGVYAFNKMQHYVLNDFADDAREHNPAWSPIPNQKQPAAAIYVPLQVKDEPFGVLMVSSPEKGTYSDHHLNILQNLAVFITNALENARIYSQLEVQKSEIERQNKDITDSITYASRIQKAVLDSSESILNQFKDAFIFYQPRDIVSGDFYWFHRREHRRYIAVADCTGHGVAGAFLTIMGVDFFNEIVIADSDHKEPHQILEELNDKFMWMTYRQANKSLTDGMDVAVVVFDEKEQTIEFAGAKANIWYVRDEEIHQVRGSHLSIGRGGPEVISQFETVKLPIQADDRVYLFSDGFQDQFGGARYKKYLRKRLRSFILSISHLPMSEQKIQLAQELFHWMGDNAQTDDILVVGLKP